MKTNDKDKQGLLDPFAILKSLADSCSRANDAGFWILTSAAWHLNGYEDDEGSTADEFFWKKGYAMPAVTNA